MITEADHEKWTVNDIIPFVKVGRNQVVLLPKQVECEFDSSCNT